MIDVNRKWMSRAACAGQPVTVFFQDNESSSAPSVRTPPPRGGNTKRSWDPAKKICAICPVLWECRRDTVGEPDGYWGGRNPRQRAQARNVRSKHVRDLPEVDKEELSGIIVEMRNRFANWTDIERTVGLRYAACQWLESWHREKFPAPVTELREPGWRNAAAVKQPERSRMWELHQLGVSADEIAMRLGRARDTVIRHLRKERVERAQSTASTDEVSDGGSAA